MRQISNQAPHRLPRLFHKLLSRTAAGLPVLLSACAVQSTQPPLSPHALAKQLSPILQPSQD